MSTLDKMIKKFEEGFCAFGLLGSTFLMFVNVILRFVFNTGWPWSEELIRYVMIWMAFLGIGLATRKNAHIAIDFITYYLSEKSKVYLSILVNLITVSFCALMVNYSVKMVMKQFISGQRTPAFEIPFYLVYLALPIGYSLGLIRTGQNIVKLLRKDVN